MNYIVIVAGGKGQRMGSELPKQFLLFLCSPKSNKTCGGSYATSMLLPLNIKL